MNFNKNTKIGIIGLGLIGGSYAIDLSNKGYEVGAIDINTDSIDYAIRNKLVKHGMDKVEKDYVEQFDLLIFCLYPHTFIEWIKDYGDYIKQGALITDVTGVKGAVVNKVQAMLRPDLEYIAAHPMAGKEKSGIESATDQIFKVANYIVTPTEKNSKEAIDICIRLGEELGFKNISTLPVAEHDDMIAFLSQLTHCIAVSLMTCRDTSSMAKYSGDSFRDLTRIAKINDRMWSELFLANKDELLKQMEAFEKTFSSLKDFIKNDDSESIRSLMRKSTEQRELFDK